MPQVLTPAIDVASLEAGTQLVVWQAGGQYRVDVPGLIDFAQLGLGTAGQTLAMNAAGTAIVWQGPWASYTPTFTGFGTASAVSIWWRQYGDTLLLRGRWTAGTATAVEARVSLPPGFTSSATKVTALQAAGIYIDDTSASAFSGYTLIESNVAYITFGFASAGSAGLAKKLGTSIGSTRVISILAEIPI